MNRLFLMVMLFLVLATTAAAQKPGYVTGKVVDVRRYNEATRPVRKCGDRRVECTWSAPLN